MLPGLRFVLAAIAATIFVVVLGFVQLVKLQMAQDHSAGLVPVEARFAGLAFAERANWTPVPTGRGRSLESLEPFASVPLVQARLDEAADTTSPVQLAALSRPRPEPPREVPAAAPPVLLSVAGVAAAIDPDALAIASAPVLAAARRPQDSVAVLPPLEAEPAPAGLAAMQVSAVPPAIEQTPAVMTAAAVQLPLPRPAAAAPPSGVTPLPVTRPVISRRSEPRQAKKRIARAPTGKQTPPASAVPGNPFAALFGRWGEARGAAK